MRVTILTDFHGPVEGYSLVHVVEEQIDAMIAYGIDVRVVVRESWPKPETGWRRAVVVPALPDDLTSRDLVSTLFTVLEGTTHVVAHDLWYLGRELNRAARKVAEKLPSINWLCWCHSAPNAKPDSLPRENRTPPPGKLVCPNEAQRLGYAQQFQIPLESIVAVRHWISPERFYSPAARELYAASDFQQAEICFVYPCRVEGGKRPEAVLKIASSVERFGINAAVLIFDWQSTGGRFLEYKKWMKELAELLKFQRLTFSSEVIPELSQGAPRSLVFEMMQLADVVAVSSISETYSLIAHEGLLAGCLIVLPKELGHLNELYGDSVVYANFEDPCRTAATIAHEMKSSRCLRGKSRARTRWNSRVFAEEMLALLEMAPEKC